jgi:uncharacterized protein YdhG (YjbR/CyaY superfamily)
LLESEVSRRFSIILAGGVIVGTSWSAPPVLPTDGNDFLSSTSGSRANVSNQWDARGGIVARVVVSSVDVDDYLSAVPAQHRKVLSVLRARILDAVPEAEEVISYRVPAFRVEGGIVAGFASFTKHMSYLPFSGSVLSQLSDEINAYTHTKSSLHFTSTTPLSPELVNRLVGVRWSQIRDRGH